MPPRKFPCISCICVFLPDEETARPMTLLPFASSITIDVCAIRLLSLRAVHVVATAYLLAGPYTGLVTFILQNETAPFDSHAPELVLHLLWSLGLNQLHIAQEAS